MNSTVKLKSAFTLLELSIVLVVIGLIAGGIMVGDSMMNNAKIINVIAEQEKFKTAIKQFQEKYRALPGDMFNATSYWTALGGGLCPRYDSTAATATTCNGNGNGKIALSKDNVDVDPVTGDMYETHRAWQHLALAGLISGSYTGGLEMVVDTATSRPGVRIPPTNYDERAGWHIYYVGSQNGSSVFYDGNYGHILYLGAQYYAATAASKSVFTAKHLYNLDTKIDDGLPATGKIRSGKNSDIFSDACVLGNAYDVSDSSILCIPIFITGF